MLVSIIIVNYNTFQITCNCIESILKYTKDVSYEIIVVDNASPKDNPDEFLVHFPSIILIKSPTNGGFAKGNNLGIKHSKGDIILLLNSDTYLHEDSISKAAKFLQQNNYIGALSVKLLYPDGRLQHTCRKFRSIKNEILDLFRPFLKLLSYKTRSQIMLNQYFNGDYDTACDWISGAFMMFSASILKQLKNNVLDERFFMYGEDHLWCYQITELGYKNYYLSTTSVFHIHNASTETEKINNLSKKLIEGELEIMKYRKGNGLYYKIFKIIFVTKENIILFIKKIVFFLFKHKMR